MGKPLRVRVTPRPHIVWTLAGVILATSQAGCGLWRANVNAEQSHRAEIAEPLLEQAGFKRIPAQSDQQRAELNSLEPLAMSRTLDPKGIHYWFADPYVCQCMYAGSEQNYQRFKELRQEQRGAQQAEASGELNREVSEDVFAAPEIHTFNPDFVNPDSVP
ncbi:MAG: hypothetical protein WA005_14595 [Candidatus Binataceae bacterium]